VVARGGQFLMANDSRVDHQPFCVRFTLQSLKDALPKSHLAPPVEPGEHTVPWTIDFWQIPPRGTSSMSPQNGLDNGAVGVLGVAHPTSLWRKEGR
jgi:hypothetical protein